MQLWAFCKSKIDVLHKPLPLKNLVIQIPPLLWATNPLVAGWRPPSWYSNEETGTKSVVPQTSHSPKCDIQTTVQRKRERKKKNFKHFRPRHPRSCIRMWTIQPGALSFEERQATTGNNNNNNKFIQYYHFVQVWRYNGTVELIVFLSSFKCLKDEISS